MSGAATPGGQLSFQNTGTSGLAFLRLLSTAPGTTWLPPFGTAFVDLASTWFEFHAGTIPNQLVIPIPSNVATPAELWFQDLALDPTTLAGNLSNAVFVRLP